MEKKYFQPEIETMPVEELLKLQEEKLIKQVKYVYDNNQYYRKLMDEKGVKPEDLQSFLSLQRTTSERLIHTVFFQSRLMSA